MPHTLNVHFLPTLVSDDQLAGATIVVIDVLRATTTIVSALAAGATAVIPCLEVEEARQLARKYRGPKALGGERGGRPIEGFDFGNSPAEYTRRAVQGKRLFFTTTNGTRAMLGCRRAKRVLVGALVNLSALCQELRTEPQIEILCAGTDGEITREDVLAAGAIVERLLADGRQTQVRPTIEINDQAALALDAWCTVASVGERKGKTAKASQESLIAALQQSRGGRNLIEIGQRRDIRLAAAIDKFDVVPELLLDEWRIVAIK